MDRPQGRRRSGGRKLSRPDRGEQAQQGDQDRQSLAGAGAGAGGRVPVDGRAEVIRLITSLIDHEKYPACKLAELYARRWEIELVFDEIKTYQRDRPVLRSQPRMAFGKISSPT
ncbi:transposase [Streptomyces sp. NPDC059802]|uniref:transposase n=1 Tax=Streptomyces sp. NPDC059802 TaxID=3346952 RepID=UPI0036612128